MTEGQQIHRLLGCLYQQSKKAIFYEDLLEDFNEGLWTGKITEVDLASLCAILVQDELASYISGSHAAAGVPSDKESSKGISITNNAYTAFINEKYLDVKKASPWPRVALISSIVVTVALLAYIFYLRNEMNTRLSQVQNDLEQSLMDKERAFARIDSVVATKDSIIKKQALRIKDLESRPIPTAPTKVKKKR